MRARRDIRCLIPLAVALLVLLAPSGAAAANVVNGGFESGNLSGWHVHQATEAGNWFAYEGVAAPIGSKRGAEPVQGPPQGLFAAVADEANPDTLILYQDVGLGAGLSHRLSLLAYYNSYEPIAVPTPDTLSVDEEVLAGQGNQQYRIDVMRPDAPIESVDPADILRTVFQTKPGDPKKMQPTKLTADLTQFAGQTVRLRVATAAHEEVLNAGVDAVSISSTGPGGSLPGSNGRIPTRFGLGKARANREAGTVTLSVRVPGPGLLTAKSKSTRPSPPLAAMASRRPLGVIAPVTLTVHRAGRVSLPLKLKRSAWAILKRRHKLLAGVTVTYRPTVEPPTTVPLLVGFKLESLSHGQ